MRIVFSSAAAGKVVFQVLKLIKQNTRVGIDADGQPFAPYSTLPFVRPAAGLQKKALKSLEQSKLLTYFNTKEGKLWVLIQGGYAALKKAQYPGDNTVNLSAKGSMLRSLGVLSVDEGGGVIGFTRQEEAEKASYHILTGAGKRKTLRNFLGLSDATIHGDEKLQSLISGGIEIIL